MAVCGRERIQAVTVAERVSQYYTASSLHPTVQKCPGRYTRAVLDKAGVVSLADLLMAPPGLHGGGRRREWGPGPRRGMRQAVMLQSVLKIVDTMELE